MANLSQYSGIPISQTLIFFNLLITQTKSCTLSVEHCNLDLNFLNYPIFRTNFISLGGTKNQDSTVLLSKHSETKARAQKTRSSTGRLW